MITIQSPQSELDYEHVGQMLQSYAQMLGIDFCTGNIDKEIGELPGQYGPPRGLLLIATVDGQPAGCVGLRDLGDDICEMKRLFIKPQFRGQGIGRQLATRLISEAMNLGYHTMRLDTLESMTAARALYKSMGFAPIEPYNIHPPECTHFMELQLQPRTLD